MAHPPINPISGDKSYFKKLCEISQEYLKGIDLKFEGYEETISRYWRLESTDIDEAWNLMKELNAWSEYFSDIASLIQKEYLDSETEKIQLQSSRSIEFGGKSVASGDRHANVSSDVIGIRKQRNALKALYEDLLLKIKFLERAHYHCKSTCDWGHKLSQTKYRDEEFSVSKI